MISISLSTLFFSSSFFLFIFWLFSYLFFFFASFSLSFRRYLPRIVYYRISAGLELGMEVEKPDGVGLLIGFVVSYMS